VSEARLFSKLSIGLLATAFALVTPSAARAFSPYLVVPDPALAEASPAYRYANMTDAEALAELERRGVLHSRLDAVPGVRAPIRLIGRLHGVYVHSSLPPEKRMVSPFEILDARLALALDDFCALLERHDIDEVVHFTMYRPNVAAPSHDLPDKAPVATAGKVFHDGAASREMRPRPRPGADASGARPRLEARTSTPIRPKAPVLGAKGTLDGRKVGGAATARTQQQKSDDGSAKPDSSATRGPARKSGKGTLPRATTSLKTPARQHAVPAAGVSAGARVARRDSAFVGLHQTTWAPPGTRHPAGLAIDVGLLHRRDGRWLSVQHDFQGHVGAKTCGEGAPSPDNPDARELRALVCESSDLGLFTYVLTPDYNAAHADHFHMEIKPGVRWFLYH
jgi:hypothetical protein